MIGIIFARDACDSLLPGNRCRYAPYPYNEYVCYQYCRRMTHYDALCELLPQLELIYPTNIYGYIPIIT